MQSAIELVKGDWQHFVAISQQAVYGRKIVPRH